MAREDSVFTSATQMSNELLKDVWLPGLYDLAFDSEGLSFLSDRIERVSDLVEGMKAKVPFLLRYGWSIRAMGRQGYFPMGSPPTTQDAEIELGMHAGGLQALYREVLDTEGKSSKIGKLTERLMEGFRKSVPYYIRSLLWTPSSGIIAVVSNSGCTANVVSLDNDGLWNTEQTDRCKYIQEGMWLQCYTSAGVTRGEPVQVVDVDESAGTFEVDSDPGIVENDFFVITTADGWEDCYNADGMIGLPDVIDDDNTFQGVDRSASGMRELRATLDNTDNAAALSLQNLNTFFRNLRWPKEAVTDPEVVDYIWRNYFRDKERYANMQDLHYGYSAISIGRTKLVATDDGHRDSIVAVDLDNVKIADKGEFTNFLDRGWYQIEKRPIVAYDIVWPAVLYALQTRRMGRYYGFDIDTDPS